MTVPFGSGRAAAAALDIAVHDFQPASSPSGRSVYLQGQLHANESASMLVLLALVRMLTDDRPANMVRVVPNANPLGWQRYIQSGHGRISADGVNWNRMFAAPTHRARTADERLAQALWQLSSGFDVVIDAHTPEFGWAHVYASSPERRLTTMDDIPHVIYGAPSSGPFDESHLRLREAGGLPPVWASVTVEIPSHSIPTEAFVESWAKRLFEEITAQGRSTAPQGSPRLAGRMLDIVPEITGAVVLRCRPGHIVDAGNPLLEVHGRRGEVETLRAPRRGVPVCFRRATVVQSGYWACRMIDLS